MCVFLVIVLFFLFSIYYIIYSFLYFFTCKYFSVPERKCDQPTTIPKYEHSANGNSSNERKNLAFSISSDLGFIKEDLACDCESLITASGFFTIFALFVTGTLIFLCRKGPMPESPFEMSFC